MRIIVNTSTYREGLQEPTPSFINNLINNMSKDKSFYILYPMKSSSRLPLPKNKNITLIPYRYFFFKKFQTLDKLGLLPSIKKNNLNFVKVLFLILFQFVNLLVFSVKLKPDYIYAHWVFPQAFISSIVGKLLNIKVVFTSHGSDVLILRKIKYLGNFIVKFTLKNSSKYTFVSSKNKTFIPSNFIDSNSSSVIPMGISDEFYNTEKTNHESKGSFLYFGRLVDYKGVDILIQSLKKIKDSGLFFNLNIIGEGVEKNNLINLVNELNMSDNVKFHNFKNTPELIKIIDHSELVFIPSIEIKNQFEAGPLSLIESLAREKVCIVSNSIGFVDYLNSKNSIVFKSGDIESLYHSILKFINLNEDEKKLIQTNGIKVSQKFNYSKISHETETFLFGRD
jgi:glycosyltransferase involved in cell wall biosynthesis